MNTPVEWIVNARWVLPIIPEKTVYQNYAVVVGTNGEYSVRKDLISPTKTIISGKKTKNQTLKDY
jgi:hypothetical protein